MRISILFVSICAVRLLSAPAFADEAETVVVTATRAEGGAALATLGASVTMLDAETLDTRQTRVVADILRDVPGVSVNRTGGAGGQTQVRLRGAEANHTLVLIDGMEVSNPFYGEFDFATLIADDVARVEVLRGQQSALYGSDAIGGVVHYITADGADLPGVRGRVEYGSFNSWDAAVRFAAVSGPVDFALSGGHQQSDGAPVAREGSRDIGASSDVISGKATLRLADNARIRAVGRYVRTEAETAGQDFNWPPSATYGFAIDGDQSYDNAGAYGMVTGEFEALDGSWRHALSVQGVDAARDSFMGGALSARDEGGRVKGSYVTSFVFGDAIAQTLTGALDVEDERFRTRGPFLSADQEARRGQRNVGAVIEYEARAGDRWGFGAALRRDDNERFNDATTYRLQGSYLFGNTMRVHAAAGSGIKNPGVYELFGYDPNAFVGNPDLKPERSIGWEAGVAQSFLNGAAGVDVTYFDARLKDEITTDFVGPNFLASPRNLSSVSTQRGVEIAARAALGTQWRIDATYTYLDAVESRAEEVRRPPHIASVNVAWRSTGGGYDAFLTARYNGEMQDLNFTQSGPPRVTLPAYTLVNFGGEARLNAHAALYARVENALDETYEDVYTFRSPGRAAFVGVKAAF